MPTLSEIFPRAYTEAGIANGWIFEPEYLERVQFAFDELCDSKAFNTDATEAFSIEAIEILLLAVEKVGLK